MMLSLWMALATSLAATPLTLERLLDGVTTDHPVVAKALANQDAAEGVARSARGALDPVLAGKASLYDEGKTWDIVDLDVIVPTIVGPSMSVGYARGTGEFPTYDGRATGPDGELTVGASVPLLQGLWVSEVQASIRAADFGAMSAAEMTDWVQIKARQDAGSRWWQWVGATEALRIAEQQLELAEARQAALIRQVELGAKPELDALDNGRSLAERRAGVINARQKQAKAAINLSLWWREPLESPTFPEMTDATPDGEANRADVRAAERRVEQSEVLLRWAKAGWLPELDVGGVVARDIRDGSIDARLDASVKLRLSGRKQRGAVDKATASVTKARVDADWLRQKAAAEVDKARIAAEAAKATQVELVDAAELADQALDRQRIAWELGQGDLFRLLQRENTVAKTQKAVVDATVLAGLAELELRAALGQL